MGLLHRVPALHSRASSQLHLAKKCTCATFPALPAETHEAEVFQSVRLGLRCANALLAKAGVLMIHPSCNFGSQSITVSRSPAWCGIRLRSCRSGWIAFSVYSLPCRVPSSVRRKTLLGSTCGAFGIPLTDPRFSSAIALPFRESGSLNRQRQEYQRAQCSCGTNPAYRVWSADAISIERETPRDRRLSLRGHEGSYQKPGRINEKTA
ncbi:hypothetical protein B0T26DRAFT_97969 [Lasiosphaeria miniovina]|uniref:Uncharacterized protein n=1 Tax=Lasiosphaeria miniovina TaxID=1954250 RepID=A0AA40BJC2_9PEZI|nr:uncharacterized protein B0T26DRAFT_97969 [Lasiosphaeria miniovina]KAK0735188.1 hypothetical protein B0T26DRAFT_97969 [Lasiosphaeria miniovina]